MPVQKKVWKLIESTTYICCIVHCVVINNEEHVCVWKYKTIFLFSVMILMWSRKQSQRVGAHRGAVRRWKSQWITDFSWNSGTYIVYNSHVTCSNSSFLLTMVMPTSHFFAFHWLCCLLPIGYMPKPGSVGVRICHDHWIQPHPPFRGFSDIFDWMHLFSI